MKATDAMMFVAVVAVALATMNLIITINKIGNAKVLSGYATDTATANLTIQSNLEINFTTDNIDWGTGYVNTTDPSCELSTYGNMNCTGFATVTNGLVLENIGNEDANLTMYASKDADSFIGAGAVFEWNVSEIEAGSCPDGVNMTELITANTTMVPVCDNFTFYDTDTLRVDLRIVIPENAPKTAKGVTITANAETI